MTDQDLITAALQHFFTEDEVKGATFTLFNVGPGAAIEYLRSRVTARAVYYDDLCVVETHERQVIIKTMGRLSGDPEVIMAVGDFCAKRIHMVQQPRLV